MSRYLVWDDKTYDLVERVPVPQPSPVPVPTSVTNQRTGALFPSLATAQAGATAGDTLLATPSIYGPFNLSKSLTLKGGSPRAILDAKGLPHRLIDQALGVSLVVEGFEFRGNKVEWGNAAGIWPSGGAYQLTVRNCVFHDLSNGILIGAHPLATILLEDCEFYDCGDYNGMGHNIYVGNVASFTMRRCYSHMVKNRGDAGVPNWQISWGHLVKSRAAVTRLEDCRFTMEKGEANRCIDLPNGGDVEIRRCKLEYRTPQNNGGGQLISFGVEEGTSPGLTLNHPKHRLIIEDNILVNRHPSAGVASLWVRTTEPTEYRVRGNIFAGAGQPSVKGDAKWAIPLAENRVVALTDFVDVDGYDWRIKPPSTGGGTTTPPAPPPTTPPPAPVPPKTASNLDGLPLNEWVAIPGTDMVSGLTPLLPVGFKDFGTVGLAALFDAWGSAALDRLRGRMHFRGGGHADSSNNGIPYFDLETMTWGWTMLPSIITAEQVAHSKAAWGTTAYTFSFGYDKVGADGKPSDYWVDGKPCANHAYGNVLVDENGDVLLAGRQHYWRIHDGVPTMLAAQTVHSDSASVYDPVTKKVYTFGADEFKWWGYRIYDVATNTVSALRSFGGNRTTFFSSPMIVGRKIFLFQGNYPDANIPVSAWTLDLDTGATADVPLANPPQKHATYEGTGDYCAGTGVAYFPQRVRAGGGHGAFTVINPATGQCATWIPNGTPPPLGVNPPYGKFRGYERRNGQAFLVWFHKATAPLFVVRVK